MTLTTTSSKQTYTGDGSTVTFPIPFKFFQNSDLVVTITDLSGNVTTKTLTTDYSVTGAGNASGGTLTMVVAPTLNYTLTIERVVPLTQATSIRNQGAFFANIHEDEFDRLVMADQQLQQQITDNNAVVLAGPVQSFATRTGIITPQSGDYEVSQVTGSAHTWGYKLSTTAGLTFGYYGGPAWNGITYASIADGTVALAASHTNYVQRTAAGVVSANTTGWTAGQLPMYVVVTGTSTITSVTDQRVPTMAAPSVAFTQTGAGAVLHTLQDKAQQAKSVLDYGAVGNGVTDDSSAIQAAVNANKGGRIIFPRGYNFLFAGLLLDGSSYNGTTLDIEGQVTLKASGGATNFQSAVWGGIILHSVDGVTVDVSGIFNGNRAAQAASESIHCLVIAGATHTFIPNFVCTEIQGDGIYIDQATLVSSSANSSDLVIGNVFGYNSSDAGRNLVSIISCVRGSIGTLTSYQIGGTPNATREPGGLDIEPGAGYKLVTDWMIGTCNVTSGGTSGIQILGQSISGVDASMDWNVSRITIGNFNLTSTAAAAAAGAPNFFRANDISVKGTVNRVNAGNGIFFDFLNRVNADVEVIGATVGVQVGTSGYVYDFQIKVQIPKYIFAGLQVSAANRGRFTGRIYGATNATNTFAIYTTTTTRGALTQSNVIYAVDAPYDGFTLRAFRNDPVDPITYGVGTRAESCDWTGYASPSVMCDAQIPTVSIQGRNYQTVVPGNGAWAAGDVVFNSAPAVGQPTAWVCTAAGSPGTWAVVGLAGTAAVSSATLANPVGTTSTTQVMMGLAGAITPGKTGTVIFTISGQMANATVNDGATIQLYTGTGTAPTNGTAVGSAGTARTARGLAQTHTSLVAGDTGGFSVSFPVTGLTPGTAYWYDLAVNAVTGGTATVTGITASAEEQ